MPKKADTPQRKARRNYEVRNKDAREQATMQFNTRLPREECDEICAFLKKHGISKVDLIREGYRAMKTYYCPKDSREIKEEQRGAQGLRPLRSCFYREYYAKRHKKEGSSGR